MTDRMAKLTVILGLVIAFAAAHPVLDPDMWWHLAVGESILQHRSVYFVDTLSFTNPKIWVNSQWMTEVIFATLHKIVGIEGLEAIALVLKVIAFLLVFEATKAPPLTRVWVTILFAFGAFPLIGGVRPQLFSFLFVAWLSLTIHQHRQLSETRNLEKPKWQFANLSMFVSIPLLFAIWANVHSFYPVAFALLSLAIVADYANERRKQPFVLGQSWRRQMALTLSLCLVTIMFTPFGWNSPKQVIVNIIQSSQLPIEEWKPAVEMKHPLVIVWAGLLLLWLICLAWSPKRPDALELLWGAFATFSALTGVRMIALWCLIVAPFVSEHIGQWTSQLSRPIGARSKAQPPSWLPVAVVSLCAFLTGIVLAPRFSPSEFIKREKKEYPRDAVAQLEKFVPAKNCLTRYDWGGYIAWKLKGRVKVFVDGRADFYPTKVMRDFMTAYFGKERWQEVLNKYGVTVVIAPTDAPIANLLSLKTGEWRCIYKGEVAVIFVRRVLAASLQSQPTKPQKASEPMELRLPQVSIKR
ncbi:MAG: hypothetical protein ACUVRR_03435 [Candidatus Fervidibacter sp.]|uniref:hypothetical protein n=1 Tax=Candidatus Fervidibacter sp. TaxID=3100871 RepID=UPI00404960BA